MDSERTRNLKELRQKRLQYYDKLQPQSSSKATNSHPTCSTDRQKITHKQTQPSTSRRSILAWDSPNSSPKSSPSLRKKQSIQNAAPSSTQNSTPFQSRIGNSAQYRSSSDRKDESYVSPMRRSLSHAQSFRTTPQRNTLNGDEFSYSYQDFRPVERERYFSTKPVEDVSWPPHTTSAGNGPRREANVSSNKKISSTESSRQVHNKSSIKTDDITFDADYVENILQEMKVVRKMKTQVHDELKTNFDNHNGKTPFTKYDHVSTKYGNDMPPSATKYGHNHTKEGDDIDIDHSTHRTFDLSKQQDSRSSELSSDQNLEDDQVKISEQTSNIKLTYRIGNDNEGKEKKEESEEEGDEDFNLGALQEAAKQGDDILRRYIKRLSQRLHSKAVDEHTSGDNTSLGQSLERKPMEEQRSDDDRYTRFEPGPGSAPWEERVGNNQNGGLEENNNEIDASFIQSHNEHHFELNDVTYLVKESIPRKEFIDGNHEGITECNHVTEDEDHVTEKSDHVTNYQPKIAQPTMTSSKLQELGLLDDIFSSTLNLQSNAMQSADKQLDAEQIVDPIDTKSEEFQLQTHRLGHRPVSPLKNVRTNSSLSEKTQNLEFSYVHVPDASESISDMDIEIHHNVNMNSDSSESDKVSNKNKHPKPPEVAKKPTSSLRRVHHANSSSSNALNKPSNPKRVKTPERHVVGIREHHEKERDVRKQTNNISPRRGATSPTRGQFNEKSPGRAPVNQKVSVVTSSFLRGVTPEPKAELLSVPSLDFHDDDDGDHHEDQMALFDDMVGDGGVDETGQEDDNETVLMQRIADFKPPFGGANQMDASGDAPNRNWHPQVSFELPHQEAIDDLLGRASDTEKRKVGVPNARPSSAGPSQSTSGVLHRGRPSSAKSKVSKYMDGSTQFKRRWATSSSLWGSRSISAGGDLEVAGQRSKVTDGSSKSPMLVRKARPGSAKHVGAGDADMVGSRMKGQRSRPWSAGYGGNTQKEDFLNVGASQLRDGQVVRALDSYANRAVPPLTMQLIVESPRTSEGISVWQLLPDEILLHIFTYLSHYDLTQCAQTCSFFNRIVLDDSLWRHIHLEKKVLTDFGLTQIGERHPTHLGFVQCTGNITENGLRNLFRSCAESLKELNVSGCSNGELSGDSLLLHASRCYNLKRLDASWCSVTDNGLTAINDSIHQLNSLCLNGCREVSDQCLRAVIEKHGKSLSVLEVFGCFNLSTDSLMFIGDTCKHLRTLNIGQCYKLTDESIANLAPHIKGVRHLDLRGCKQIRDWCIRKIVRHCKKLESLVLANCSHIGNTALNEIATYLPNMRHIDLAGCKRVTNEGVKALATNCHQLTTLDISSTGIDHRSVTALASYCSKSLQGIKLNCCKEITEASIVKLLKHCKQLETLHLYGVKRLHTLSVLKLQYPCLMYDEKSRAPPRFRQSES